MPRTLRAPLVPGVECVRKRTCLKAGTGSGRLLMQRERRLRKPSAFAAARRGGRSWGEPLLVLVARRNGSDASRIGFAVGRRVGNAVVRNRIKRRLRALASSAEIADGWDLVFIARRDAASSSFRDLTASMSRLLRRARLTGT